MTETLQPEAFEITAFEGRVLVEAPGLAATLDVDAALFLSGRLHAACGAAQQQIETAIDQAPNSGPSSSG